MDGDQKTKTGFSHEEMYLSTKLNSEMNDLDVVLIDPLTGLIVLFGLLYPPASAA